MKKRFIIMAILVAFSWGINASIVKLTLNHIPLFFFCTLRCFILSFLLLFFPKTRYPLRITSAFALAHGVKISALYTSVTVGLAVGLSTVILQTQSLFAVLLALLIFREKLSLRQAGGLFLSFLGVLLIGNNALEVNSGLGFLFALISAISSGFAIITLRGYKNLTTKEAFSFVGWFNLLSIIPFGLLSLFIEGTAPWENILSLLTPYVIFLITTGAITVISAYGFLGLVMAQNETAQVGPYLLLTPIFGISGAYVCLNEYCALLSLLGTAVIILGIAVSQGVRFPFKA